MRNVKDPVQKIYYYLYYLEESSEEQASNKNVSLV